MIYIYYVFFTWYHFIHLDVPIETLQFHSLSSTALKQWKFRLTHFMMCCNRSISVPQLLRRPALYYTEVYIQDTAAIVV